MRQSNYFRSTAVFLSCLTAGLFLSAPAFSDSVTLTSGRVLKGSIIEKGEGYIKIQTDAGIFRIKKRQIEEFKDGSGSGASSAKGPGIDVEAALEKLADELSDEDWKARLDDYKEYFNKIHELQKQYMVVLATSTAEINKELKRGKYSAAIEAGRRSLGHILYVQQQFDKIDVYPELQPYHEKVSESLRLTAKSIKAWLLGDQYIYHRYRKESIKAMIDSMEQYAIFSQVLWMGEQGRPQMDAAINAMKEKLQAQYY